MCCCAEEYVTLLSGQVQPCPVDVFVLTGRAAGMGCAELLSHHVGRHAVHIMAVKCTARCRVASRQPYRQVAHVVILDVGGAHVLHIVRGVEEDPTGGAVEGGRVGKPADTGGWRRAQHTTARGGARGHSRVGLPKLQVYKGGKDKPWGFKPSRQRQIDGCTAVACAGVPSNRDHMQTHWVSAQGIGSSKSNRHSSNMGVLRRHYCWPRRR